MRTFSTVSKPAVPGQVVGTPEDLESARILIVDDDERNLLAIRTVLEPVAEVVTANSGEAALRCLLRQEFAVILLDVYMPEMDGYETANFIRQRQQSKGTPIIFLSAVNKEDVHMLRGYDMGAVDYVFKPFDPTILKSKVAVFVDLFEKTQEIQRNAVRQQRLMEENLRANNEKLAMERALRQSEERQALILRSLPLALYVEDLAAQGRSPQFIGGDLGSLTGFDLASLNKTPWSERIHPEERSTVARTIDVLTQTGSAVVEYRWMCADGVYKHFLDQSVVLRDVTGRAIGRAGTLLDVTERRHLEDRLIQAQRLDAVGKLTGGVAHDLNNVLASVLGGLRLIERRMSVPDDIRNMLDMTRHAAEQGAELIRRMLAFSRRQHLKPEVFYLHDLGNNMKGMVGHLLGGLVRFEWDVGDKLWPVFIDAGQLELALMNLVVNARDAMPSGGTITITGENRSVDFDNALGLVHGDYVVISVFDTGCGIPAANLERVVEPFFTTKEVGKGTGLGLSTVYGFARQSGGALSIESTEGRGTRVDMWLPQSQISDAGRLVGGTRQKEKPIHRDGADEAPVDYSGVILLVDDTREMREITAALLTERGMTVVPASGGGEALALLEKDPKRFDLILTDFAMPLVSGLDVIRFARNLRADIPAIIITGYADTSSIVDKPLDVPLLTKPFSIDDLERLIGSMIPGGR